MLITGVHAHALRSSKGLTTGETGCSARFYVSKWLSLNLGAAGSSQTPAHCCVPNPLPQLPAGLQSIYGASAMCSSARSPEGSMGSGGP